MIPDLLFWILKGNIMDREFMFQNSEQAYKRWVELNVTQSFMWRPLDSENNCKTVIISCSIQKNGVTTGAKVLKDCSEPAFTEYCFGLLDNAYIREIHDGNCAPVHIKCTFKSTREVLVEFIKTAESV